MYNVKFSKEALDGLQKIDDKYLKKVKELLEILKIDPFQVTPPYIKLIGDLYGYYSRNITINYKLIYSVYKKEKQVIILYIT